jgi:hypothetical protein
MLPISNYLPDLLVGRYPSLPGNYPVLRGQGVIWNYPGNNNFVVTDFGYRSLPLGTAPVRASYKQVWPEWRPVPVTGQYPEPPPWLPYRGITHYPLNISISDYPLMGNVQLSLISLISLCIRKSERLGGIAMLIFKL